MLRFAVVMLSASLLACSSSTTAPAPLGQPDSSITTDTSVTPDTAVADSKPGADSSTGCKTTAECFASPDGKICDTTVGKCVECTAASDTCADNQHCDTTAKKCVAGCKNDLGCMTAGADAGVEGGVAAAKCDVATNTCVQCLADPDCPAGYVCAGKVCSMGCSPTKACPTGQACCTGACVDTQANNDNCGGCGTKCTSVGSATTKCVAGACAIDTCPTGTADCDKVLSNACETDTSSNLSNCGACGKTCPFVVNGLPACTAGKCDAKCDTGFANCDGDLSNGCETNVLSNRNNCGTCGTVCPSTLVNGSPVCSGGTCTAVCNTGYGDCDSNLTNGCETSIVSNPLHCGGCGIACAALPNATATCGSSACIISSCNANFANCDGVIANGCESNIKTDPNNCNACGTKCSLANANNTCTAGVCGIGSCIAPYRNCNSTVSDGCEINTDTDRNNCGACGTVCPMGEACVAGVCKYAPSVVYSASLTGGVATTSAECSDWNAFRAAINATTVYNRVTIRGSRDPVGVSCSGANANTLCQALRAGTSLSSISCDGRNWKVGLCNTSTAFNSWEISANGDTCSCSTGYISRPCILHRDWGGVNGVTCNAPTQTLEVICE